VQDRHGHPAGLVTQCGCCKQGGWTVKRSVKRNRAGARGSRSKSVARLNTRASAPCPSNGKRFLCALVHSVAVALPPACLIFVSSACACSYCVDAAVHMSDDHASQQGTACGAAKDQPEGNTLSRARWCSCCVYSHTVCIYTDAHAHAYYHDTGA
jgi:hypothetical protein